LYFKAKKIRFIETELFFFDKIETEFLVKGKTENPGGEKETRGMEEKSSLKSCRLKSTNSSGPAQ
jgi:hypothetical protein